MKAIWNQILPITLLVSPHALPAAEPATPDGKKPDMPLRGNVGFFDYDEYGLLPLSAFRNIRNAPEMPKTEDPVRLQLTKDYMETGGTMAPAMFQYFSDDKNPGKSTLIARRFLDGIGCDGAALCDMTHNLVVPREGGWLHRKGAAPSDPPFVLIPGSRGALSYVVHPLRDDAEHGWSLAHGAGRKWDRGSTRARLEDRYTAENLQKTRLGSRVLCADKDLLFEEAPEAYKDIDGVIADLTGLGLARVVASLRPVLTYKTDGSGRRWN